MIRSKWPTLKKFLENCIARLQMIDLPAQQAARNYVNNIPDWEKEQLIQNTEQFLEAVEENLEEYHELAWSSLSAQQVRDFMGSLLAEMRK